MLQIGNKKLLLGHFGILHALTLVLLGVLFFAILNPPSTVEYISNPTVELSGGNDLIKAEEKLRTAYANLLSSDEEYYFFLANFQTDDQLALLSKERQHAENVFQYELKRLDKISTDEKKKKQQMKAFFEAMLQNRNSMSIYLESPASGSAPESQIITALREQLRKKEEKLAEVLNDPHTTNIAITARDNEISRLRGEVSQKNDLIEKSELQLAETDKQIKDLQQQLARNATQAAGTRTIPVQSTYNYDKELKQLKTEIAEKNRQLSGLQAKRKNQHAGKSAADPSVIKDLKLRNQRLSTAYNVALTQFGVLNKKYKALQNQHAALAAKSQD